MFWHTVPIFVYGTLKRGQPNHYLIQQISNGRHYFLGTALTVRPWPMVISPPNYAPCILDYPDHGEIIHGELYYVDVRKLDDLDRLEQHPDYYTREGITVTLEQIPECSEGVVRVKQPSVGSTIKCEVYLMKNFNKALLELPFISNYDNNVAEAQSMGYNLETAGGVDVDHIKMLKA